MNGFTEISHTADIGLEVWADSYSNLFRYAMYGYYKLVLPGEYSSGESRRFSFFESDSGYENLLISFLSEINFKLMVEKQVVNPVESIKINKMENTDQLEVTGFIHTLQYPEESIEIEIKAVTYHQVNIVEENGIYRTKIFFDI